MTVPYTTMKFQARQEAEKLNIPERLQDTFSKVVALAMEARVPGLSWETTWGATCVAHECHNLRAYKEEGVKAMIALSLR